MQKNQWTDIPTASIEESENIKTPQTQPRGESNPCLWRQHVICLDFFSLWVTLPPTLCSNLQTRTGNDTEVEATALCSHNYRAQDHHDQIRTERVHWRTYGPGESEPKQIQCCRTKHETEENTQPHRALSMGGFAPGPLVGRETRQTKQCFGKPQKSFEECHVHNPVGFGKGLESPGCWVALGCHRKKQSSRLTQLLCLIKLNPNTKLIQGRV